MDIVLTAEEAEALASDTCRLYLAYIECAELKGVSETRVTKIFPFFEKVFHTSYLVDHNNRTFDEKVGKTLLVVMAAYLVVGSVRKGDQVPKIPRALLFKTYQQRGKLNTDQFPYLFGVLKQQLGAQFDTLFPC